MSSSTFFQSMLLSKPRIENFHGSRIKSAEFIVSSRFSGFKFNASPSSNLKVRSFICCCVKVQNFVNSTACSSTSKIANFEEAKENYFEKVLIYRILKVVKWLKIPAVLVLLLPMTISGRRGDSAMAASSGVIVGDHRSISSSLSDESSSAFINGKQESSSGVFIIIFVSAVLVYILLKLYDESTRGQTKVIKLQVGLRVPISYFVGIDEEEGEDGEEDEFAEIIKPSKTKSSYSMWTYSLHETAGTVCNKYMPYINTAYLSVGLRVPISYFVGIDEEEDEDGEEDEFAEIIKPSKTKSSYSMRTYSLRETAGTLCNKYMPYINNAYLSVKVCKSREDAAAYFWKLSNEEQKKFDFLNEIRKLNSEKTNTNRRGLFNNSEWTHVVVTILVAARGQEVHKFPNYIGYKGYLYSAFKSFVRMSLPQFAEIQALNVFWTPLIKNYGLTDMEVRTTYPQLCDRKIWGN